MKPIHCATAAILLIGSSWGMAVARSGAARSGAAGASKTVGNSGTRAVTPPSFSRLYVFGDSYSDGGAGYVDGNGPPAVAYMAHDLGLKLVPADVGGREDGLNFAVSGASTGAAKGRAFGRALLGRGMQDQIGDFVDGVRAGRFAFDGAAAIFFIAGGLNDRALTTEQSVANLQAMVARLHAVGARRFVLARTPVELIKPAVGVRLNPALPALAAKLRIDHSDATVTISDWGDYFDRVRLNGRRYGFTDVTHACAARAIFALDPVPCADPERHLYYHDLHPSTRAHAIVGSMLAREARETWGVTDGRGPPAVPSRRP